MPDRRRWPALVVLSGSVAVAFGALFYAFSVLITEEAAGGRFSTTVLSTAYGGFVLASGALAFKVGRIVDRRGVRPVLLAGSVFGAAGLAAFSLADSPWQVIAASWVLMGPAGALLFYEPAFVAVDQWFGPSGRGKALAVLTVIGGLAGPVFLPLTGVLVDRVEWRPAARLLAAAVLVAGATAAVAMPGRRASHTEPPHRVRLRDLTGDPRFMLFTLSIVLTFGAMQSVFFHRIAVFEAAGFSVALASAWAGVASLLSLPGRYVTPLLGERFGGLRLHAGLGILLAGAVALMITADDAGQMIAHYVVFGLGFGGFLPIRALIMGHWYSGPGYGSIMGFQWSVAAVSGAAGPWLVGIARDASGGYDAPMWVVVGAMVVAAALSYAALRWSRRGPEVRPAKGSS